MYPVSEGYRQAMARPVRTERLTGTLQLTNGETVTFGPADLMSGSVTVDDQCVTGEELQFGCVYLGQAAFQLRTALSRYVLYGAKLQLVYGVQLADGSWEDVPLGVYTVAEAERTSMAVSIHAYDNILALDREYAGPALQGTPFGMLSQIAEHCGLALGMEAADLAGWPNAEETFQLDTNDGCATWRDCAGAVAQLLGAFVTVDRSGALVARRFADEPCRTLAPDARLSAAVADYHCTYSKLVVETADAEYTCDDEGGGLTMTMVDAPLFGKGLDTRNQALAEAVFEYLQTVGYVPATVTLPGDPAIDCGDRLALTEPGDATGQAVAETIVTHRIWKFRGAETLKGVGKNPRLATARDREAATLRRLQTQNAENRLIFYNFTNVNAVTAPSGAAVTAAGVRFVTVQATGALLLAQLLLTAVPEDEALTLTVQYILNGLLIGDYCPAQALAAGAHTLALFYPLTEIEADMSCRLEIRLLAAGGTVRLAAGALRGVVTGQGMAATSAWDGNLVLQEFLPAITWQAQAMTLAGLADAAPDFEKEASP